MQKGSQTAEPRVGDGADKEIGQVGGWCNYPLEHTKAWEVSVGMEKSLIGLGNVSYSV